MLRIRAEHRAARRQFETERRVPIAPLEEVFGGISSTKAILQAAVPTPASIGNMPIGELVILATVCAHLKPEVIFEFGTYDGLTTLHLAMNSAQKARLLTIDLDPSDPIRQTSSDDTFYTRGVTIGAHFKGTEEEDRIHQIFADTTQFDVTEWHTQMDFIFVDAGHTYELVKLDTQKAFQMIKPGGVIFWHDYYYTQVGVYTLLNEVAASVSLVNIANTSLVCHVSPPE